MGESEECAGSPPNIAVERAPRSQDRGAGPQHVSDHLANERTFLAWVRTAIAIIALGFVVARFALYLRSLAAGGAAIPATLSRSALLGVALVGLGAVTVLLGFLRYLATYRAIERNTIVRRAG